MTVIEQVTGYQGRKAKFLYQISGLEIAGFSGW